MENPLEVREYLLSLSIEIADTDEFSILLNRRLTRDKEKVADTLALPATYWMEPRVPYPTSLGCGWATTSPTGGESDGSAS